MAKYHYPALFGSTFAPKSKRPAPVPCPKCSRPMPASYAAKGYQCDRCARAEEEGEGM